jgi:AcrR family transcriptional regulator
LSRAPVELLQTYRRDQILAAANEVIREEGYAHASVDRIAKRAGLSRSTIYEYFPSKDEILKGCFAASREDQVDALARRIDHTNTMEAQLAGFFEICLAQVDQNREFFCAIAFPIPLYEATEQEGPGSTEFALVLKAFNEEVDRILDDGYRRGELERPIGPADRSALGTLIVGAMAARSRLDAPPPLGESAASLASFSVRGLGLGTT